MKIIWSFIGDFLNETQCNAWKDKISDGDYDKKSMC